MAFESIKKSLSKVFNPKKEDNFTFYLNQIYDKELFDQVIAKTDDRSKELIEIKPFLDIILNILFTMPEKAASKGVLATVFIFFNLLDNKMFDKEVKWVMNTYDKIIVNEQIKRIMTLFVAEAQENEESLFTLDSYVVANFHRAVTGYIKQLQIQKETKKLSAAYMSDTALITNIFVAYALVFMNIKFKKVKEMNKELEGESKYE